MAGWSQTSSSAPAASAAQQTPTTQQSAPSSSAPAQQNVPPLQLHDLPPAPHTPTPAEAAQQERERILMEVSRLATLQARWGPPDSSPGVSIDLKEVGRTKAQDGSTQIAWQITGKGFPAGEKLVLVRWPLDAKPRPLMGGIQVDSQGTAVCAGPAAPAAESGDKTAQSLAAAAANLRKPVEPAPPPASTAPAAPAPSKNTPPQPPSCAATTQPGQPVQIQAAMAPGEAMRVALVGDTEKDGKPVRTGAATSLVPFPLESTDKGCTIQVIRGMKNAGMVLVEGKGFPANTSMKVDTVSGGETKALTVRTTPQGTFIMASLPGLEGQDHGETTIHMGGVIQPPSLEAPKSPAPAAAPACNPSVTFQWGKDSYKPQ